MMQGYPGILHRTDSIELYSKRTGKKAGLMYGFIFVIMLFTGLGCFIKLSPILNTDNQIIVILWISLLAIFWAFLIIMAFFKMLHGLRYSGKPVLVIDPAGILDNTGLFTAGLMRWNEIKDIFPCTFLTSSGATRRLKEETGIAVRFTDRDSWLTGYGNLKRVMMRLKSWPGYYIIRCSSLIFENDDLPSFVAMLGTKFPVKTNYLTKVGAKLEH